MRILFGLLGCVLSFQHYANSTVADGNFKSVQRMELDYEICNQDYESRTMKCLRCGQVHDSHEKCKGIK